MQSAAAVGDAAAAAGCGTANHAAARRAARKEKAA